MLISKRWYNDAKQIELESQIWQQPFVIGLGDITNMRNVEQSFPDLSFCLPNISFNDVYTKVNYHKSYVTINRLSKKAIQTGIDAGSGAIKELEDFMNGFITKYAPKKKETPIFT
ncbi:9106_t:CDS:2 [Gigaspora rosea]|nr:9106_t:CDS:2 [Gigaspora rosea]